MLDVKWIGANPRNFGPGRTNPQNNKTYLPIAIVIHLMDGTLEGTDAWFSTPPQSRGPGGAPSSAHYGVGKNGEIHQYVREDDRAYHCGKLTGPTWPLLVNGLNPNYVTIGIEHEGRVGDVWTPAMVQSSSRLIADVAKRNAIVIDELHVIGHHELDKAKTCPGPQCDLPALIAMAKAVTA